MTESSSFEQSSSSSASPANCRYGIELTRTVSTYNVSGRTMAWRMLVTVTQSYNVDPNIFLFLRRTPDPATQQPRDTFEALCSPNDIEEYPAGAPRPEDTEQFFRLAEVDLVSRSRTLLEDTWTQLKANRDELVRTLAEICELGDVEVSRYGDFGDEEEEDEEPSEPDDIPVEPEDEPVSDDYYEILVIDSDDADFPVDSLFAETTAPDAEAGERVWELTGGGHTLLLYTDIDNHTFRLKYDGAAADTGGLSAAYGTYLNYTIGSGDSRTVQIAGVESSS